MKASTKLLAQAGLEIYATNDDETGLKKYCTISTINEVGEKLMASKEEKVIMRGRLCFKIRKYSLLPRFRLLWYTDNKAKPYSFYFDVSLYKDEKEQCVFFRKF